MTTLEERSGGVGHLPGAAGASGLPDRENVGTGRAGHAGSGPGGPLAVGVDQGIVEDIDAEPLIAAAHRRLQEAGVARGCWITTHTLRDEAGARTAYTVVLPQGPVEVSELIALVGAAFPAPEQDHDGHTHDPVGTPVLWCSAAVPPADGDRAVVYPGSDRLVGTLPVEQVGELSAIDEVVSLGGAITAGTPLVTRDHVRPRRSGGRWVLHVQPHIGGTLVPFEDPAPARCCQDK